MFDHSLDIAEDTKARRDGSPGATRAAALQWHEHIRAARSFAEAQDRMEEAHLAGVNFADLNAAALSPNGRAA